MRITKFTHNNVVSIVFAACAIIHAGHTGAIANDSLSIEPEHRYFASGNLTGYMNNMEYFNNYRVGETFFGNTVNLRVHYRPDSRLDFALGIHTRKNAGDELAFTDIRPIFRARYRNAPFSITLGELDWSNRHLLPAAIMREQFDYDKATEEGIQLAWNGKLIREDFWIVYDSLNTPSHREHLRIGSVFDVNLAPLIVQALVHWDHHGGQLYARENDPVRGNWVGGLRFGGTALQNRGVIDEIGLDETVLGSFTDPVPQETNRATGWGSTTRAWITLKGIKILLHYYQGDGFVAWQGDPIYRTNSPYYYLQVGSTRMLHKEVTLDWGARAEFIDIKPAEYAEHFENQIWVALSWNFDRSVF